MSTLNRALALGFLLFTTPSLADDVPPFLTGQYATSDKACKQTGDQEPSEHLTLDRNGIFGYESGCYFVNFHRETDPNTNQVFSYIAVASCGDDSGITRPDLISIIPENDGQTLRVQSQNEYVLYLASAVIYEPSGDPADTAPDFNYISRTYTRCR